MEQKIITDAKGRKIALRTLNVLDQVKLLRAIGPEQSSNQPYVQLVNLAASVASIDGIPCPMPVNERTIDAAIARLDDEGFNAIAVYLKKQIEDAQAAAEAAQSADGEEAKAADPLPMSAS